MYQFAAWLLYALWHAWVVYFACLYAMASPGELKQVGNGKDLGFWVEGHVVYGGCVVVANVLIMHRYNNYTGWGELLAASMLACYFTALYLENLSSMFP